MIYVRSDIPSQEKKSNLPKNVEALLVEINLRKTKFLLIGTYHSTNEKYGTKDDVFLHEIGCVLDIYSSYDKFLIVGDLNMQEGDACLEDFLHEFHAKNLVKEPTCYKNPDNPSCVDLFITNRTGSFMKTTAVSTGLSDFHKMVVTVMRTTFPKTGPLTVRFRDFCKYDSTAFGIDLDRRMRNQPVNYDTLEKIFLETLDLHAPQKSKVVRANHKPYVSKEMRKAIMLRSQLQNLMYAHNTIEYKNAFKHQKNYCNRLYKRERKKYYSNLNLNNITDNKKFWKTVKPLFGDKGGTKAKIVLVEGDKIINDDSEVAQTFNDFFDDAVKSLGISDNEVLLTKVDLPSGKVLDAIKMYEAHPSILKIKENVVVNTEFSFSPVSLDDIHSELKALNTKKAIPFMSIPPRQLKEVMSVIDKSLQCIWNGEILVNKKFPSKLKLADVSPIHKKLQTILKGNYRPVSVLAVVSKVFERIIDKQTNHYIKTYLSRYICGYRESYSPQHALLVMAERWKESRDKGGFAGGVLMDLSKAFDTINHKLLIAKLRAYGFDIPSLEILLDYFSDRWQRTKINSSFSSWSLILCGMAQGSVLGPKFFNIYINDLFYLFIHTFVCNMADDTTPYACDVDLPNLIRNLEGDVASVVSWFEANFMILNPDKCHFMIDVPKTVMEQMYIEVGDQVIWESSQEKLLGVTIDKNLRFKKHVSDICKKASGKLTALTRLATIMPFDKKKLLMNSFIQSQFAYCPLLWMFCSRDMNDKINSIHKRALRMVYLDYTSSYAELLKKDKSVTIHQRNIQLVAIEMFKVVKKLGPEIMRDLFVLDLNTKNDRIFLRPNVNSVYNGENSIRYFGPIVWDEMLPNGFESIQTLEKFKSDIKKWIPVNCPCSLCREYIGGVGVVTTFE